MQRANILLFATIRVSWRWSPHEPRSRLSTGPKTGIKNHVVHVLSCGLDEELGVYKNIRKIMVQQAELVEIVARFDPKLVKLSDDGKNED